MEMSGSEFVEVFLKEERKRWRSRKERGEERRARKSVRSTNNRFSRTICSNLRSVHYELLTPSTGISVMKGKFSGEKAKRGKNTFAAII